MAFALWHWIAGSITVATGGIVNAIANTRNAKHNRVAQEKVEENRLAIQKAGQEGNYQLQRELFQKQRHLQLELLQGNRETQLTLVQEQRETARQQPWYHKRVDNWPLRLVPEDIISAHPNRQPIPLQIILAPPEIDYDRFGNGADFPKLEKRIAQKMRSLFERYFPLETNDRPVELVDRAWDSNRFGGGSSIKTLFNQLRSESVLVLESETTGETINLRVAYWSGGAEIYNYKTAIADLPYLNILDEFARQRVLEWKTQVYDKRIAQGKTEEELRQRYPQQMAGLNVWRNEREDLAAGIPFDRHYPYIAEDDARFCEFFTSLHSLMAGVFADLHYLILENREPQLPRMLPEILPGFADAEVIRQMLESVVASYEEAFTALESDRDAWLADLRLAFAEGLTHLPDKSWVRQQLGRSMMLWLQQRGGVVEGNLSQLCGNVEALATMEDVSYLERVNRVLQKLGEPCQLDICALQRRLMAMKEKRHRQATESLCDLYDVVDQVNSSQQYRGSAMLKSYSTRSRKSPYLNFLRDIRFMQTNLHKFAQTMNEDLVKESLSSLESIISVFGRKPNVCLLGKFDSGKSTLSNGLLKDQLLPTDFQPTTALPTYIHHIDDRPDWCESNVMIFDESFNPLRWRDKNHCNEHIKAQGNINLLERYVDHNHIQDEDFLNHALVYANSDILKVCNIIDYPQGYFILKMVLRVSSPNWQSRWA